MIDAILENTPLRQINCRVEATTASTPYTFTNKTDLISVQVDRQGESKFFGFGISQKATIKIRDKDRVYNLENGNNFNVFFNEVAALPSFIATEVKRNENNNELTITAQDALYKASQHKVSEISLQDYTIKDFASSCASLLGVRLTISPLLAIAFSRYYADGANFSGNETIRDALNDVAEITQSIYYIDNTNHLRFKFIGEGDDYEIDKTKYFTLSAKKPLSLEAITSATELGDNITAGYPEDGETQTIKNNAFLDLLEDRADVLNDIVSNIAGNSNTPFTCEWRGDYRVELCDYLCIITKDDSEFYAKLITDTITYNGGYKQKSSWEFKDDSASHTNSATLGETLKETFAKVDKQGKRIDLVASEASANGEAIAALQVNTGSISASVSKMEQNTNDALGQLTGEIAALTSKVNATITPEQVQLTISQELANGVDKVETSSGFTFNETGLTISKSNSEISTTITEDGMSISKGNDAPLLTANNEGVQAIDLHATTFLIIGGNSRFEDYDNKRRTGCFWIG